MHIRLSVNSVTEALFTSLGKATFFLCFINLHIILRLEVSNDKCIYNDFLQNVNLTTSMPPRLLPQVFTYT